MHTQPLPISLGLHDQHIYGTRLIGIAAAANAPVPPNPDHIPDWLAEVADHVVAAGAEQWERSVHPLVEPAMAEARLRAAALRLRRDLDAGTDPTAALRTVAPYLTVTGAEVAA